MNRHEMIYRLPAGWGLCSMCDNEKEAEHGAFVTPAEFICDECTVGYAQDSGDWDEFEIEAAKRMGVPHPEKPNML